MPKLFFKRRTQTVDIYTNINQMKTVSSFRAKCQEQNNIKVSDYTNLAHIALKAQYLCQLSYNEMHFSKERPIKYLSAIILLLPNILSVIHLIKTYI